MHRYLRFLALFYSVARPGTTAPHRAAVLVSVPQLIVIAFSLLAISTSIGLALAYVFILVASLIVAFAIFEINVRLMQTHRKQIEEFRQDKRPAWWACTGLYALAYAYAATLVVLVVR